jgi:hypothetical protein
MLIWRAMEISTAALSAASSSSTETRASREGREVREEDVDGERFFVAAAVVFVVVVGGLGMVVDVLAESAEEAEEVEVEEGGVMISHWGSGPSEGLREEGNARRWVVWLLLLSWSSSSEEKAEESLCRESRLRLDSLGWKWKAAEEVAGWRWDRAWCLCCACCCSRSFSTCAARLRSSMARGETIVTVFFSFLGCSGDGRCGGSSKVARDGDGRYAGEVFDRVRPRGASDDVDAIAGPDAAIIPDCRLGVCGKSEKEGDFMGCGDVALRGRIPSLSSSFSSSSLMVFSLSRVACRRSNSDDLVPLGFNTPLNMTLYRSSLMSGISMLRSPPPLGEAERMGSEMIGTLASWTVISGCGSGFGLTMIGLCFGAFLPATVLLLTGPASTLDTEAVTDEVLRFASTASATLGGSACFLLPNKPNSLLFCVLVLCTVGSGVCTGGGEWLIWADDCGCHPACGPPT